MFHCSNIKILRQNGGAGLESQLNWKHASIASTWSPVRSQNPCKNAGCGGTSQYTQATETGGSRRLTGWICGPVSKDMGVKVEHWFLQGYTHLIHPQRGFKKNLGTSKKTITINLREQDLVHSLFWCWEQKDCILSPSSTPRIFGINKWLLLRDC